MPQPLFKHFPTRVNRENKSKIREFSGRSRELTSNNVSVDFSNTCLMACGRDLFSFLICKLRGAGWRRRTGRGRVRARHSGGRTTRPGKRSWYYLSTVLGDFSRYIVAWKALPHHVRFRRHGHARPGARDIRPRFAPRRLPQRPSPIRPACPITLVSLSALVPTVNQIRVYW